MGQRSPEFVEYIFVSMSASRRHGVTGNSSDPGLVIPSFYFCAHPIKRFRQNKPGSGPKSGNFLKTGISGAISFESILESYIF